MTRLILLMALSAGFLTACVPARKLQETEATLQKYQDSTALLGGKVKALQSQFNDLGIRFDELTEAYNRMEKDTAYYRKKYREVEAMNVRLQDLYEDVLKQKEELLDNMSLEKQELARELQKKEEELIRKQGELREKERELKAREDAIATLKKDLDSREQRVNELETLIARKDSAVQALKKKVSDALRGFNSEELTVEERNGKIYVSLSEQLLFKSGRTDVDPKGIGALKHLAKALQNNREIDIVIEGHTDNIPMKPGPNMADNWDLSVLRATSIVRVLTSNGVQPEQVTAAGRGEHIPVADNGDREGRALNRRTEIILSPKLDELLNLLDN